MIKLRIAFVDTNCLLHYQWLAQIEWTKLLTAEAVEIVLAPIVVRELDKQKYSPSRIRKRAHSVLSNLEKLLQEEGPAELRPGVKLRYEVREPSLDFAAYQLSRESQDDYLLASIIQFIEEQPETEVVLVTSDLGLKLKARSKGIKVLSLPESSLCANDSETLTPPGITVEGGEVNRPWRGRR